LISAYINQFLKIYPNFSDGADTSTKIKAFQFAMRDNVFDTFLAPDVEAFFQGWIRNEKKMPLPADAFAYCREASAHRTYLERNPKGQARLEPPNSKKAVPWMGLSYDEIMGSGHQAAFEAHIAELGEQKAENYVRYLKSHYGNKGI